MTVLIPLYVQIDLDDPTIDPELGSALEAQMVTSATAAIMDAVQRGEDMGFNHEMDDRASMRVLGIRGSHRTEMHQEVEP